MAFYPWLIHRIPHQGCLLTEQNVQSDVNLEYKNSHVEFFVNGFYNYINSYIYTSPTGTIRDNNDLFIYIEDNAKMSRGAIGLDFHLHPLDWLHYETSFEIVTAKNHTGDYLPLILANNWSNTFGTEFKRTNWFEAGYATLNFTSTFNQDNLSGF